jgi:hypothetical protein
MVKEIEVYQFINISCVLFKFFSYYYVSIRLPIVHHYLCQFNFFCFTI